MDGVDMTMPPFGQEFLWTAHGWITERCRALAGIAQENLIKNSQNSSSATARIAAAKAIHSHGLGAVSLAKLSVFGNDKVIGKNRPLSTRQINPCAISFAIHAQSFLIS
jgi:hypothetical protein